MADSLGRRRCCRPDIRGSFVFFRVPGGVRTFWGVGLITFVFFLAGWAIYHYELEHSVMFPTGGVLDDVRLYFFLRLCTFFRRVLLCYFAFRYVL